jgi:hypothetical protein
MTWQVEAGGVSVESPFRQHTQFDLEPDHKMNDDIPSRGEVVHRALAISYWAPTRNQTGKLWFLEHICHKVWAQIYEWSNPMHPVNDEMKSCIAECLRCYQMCLSTAMGHCLKIGGQHTQPQHFSLMWRAPRFAGLRRISCFSARNFTNSLVANAPRSANNAPRIASG